MTIVRAFVLILSISGLAFAQITEVKAKPITEADLQLLRQDVQAQKNRIITNTMTFTEPEAAAFWPVYKQYAAEQQEIAVRRFALITDYAQNLEKMDDNKARGLSERLFAIEGDTQVLRKKYFPRFEKALGAKCTAKFYQVDNRLNLIINLQLASEIPIIP